VLFIEQQFEYTLCSDTLNKLPRKHKKPKGAKKRKAHQLAYDYPATNVVPISRAQVKEFGNIGSFGSGGKSTYRNGILEIVFSKRKKDFKAE
jgi:hypothetical protein